MIPFTIIIIEILILGFLYYTKYISKKNFCIIVCISLVIVSGFRGISVGLNDTENVYLPSFELVSNTPWNHLFELRKTTSNLNDVGFLIIIKLLSEFKSEFLFIFMTSAPFIIICCRFIYKYSKEPITSFVLFMSLNLYFGSFYLIRQTVASFFLLIALELLLKKKNILFFVFVIIAGTIHSTAYIFILAFPLCKFKMPFILQIGVMVGSLIFAQYGLPLWNSIVEYFSSYFYYYTRYNYSAVGEFGQSWIIGFIIVCISRLSYDKMNEDDKNINAFINLSVIATMFYGFMPLLSEFSRIAMFFGIGYIILLPNTIFYLRNRDFKYAFYAMVTIIFCGYMYYLLPGKNLYDYYFYFN